MKYNGRLPEGVPASSKLAAHVNLNNHIESNNEKETKKSKASKQWQGAGGKNNIISVFACLLKLVHCIMPARTILC